jgi:hypothetical protein
MVLKKRNTLICYVRSSASRLGDASSTKELNEIVLPSVFGVCYESAPVRLKRIVSIE